jgi:hypothetical protein
MEEDACLTHFYICGATFTFLHDCVCSNEGLEVVPKQHVCGIPLKVRGSILFAELHIHLNLIV